MRRLLSSCTVAILLLGSVHSSAQNTPSPAPGVATGEKIGNTIKSAITTALPGLSSLVELLFSHSSKPQAQSASKSDLKQAADSADAQKQYKQVFEAAVQQKLQPLGRVADEIDVLNRFLEPTITASSYLIQIRTLAGEPAEKVSWTAIEDAWEHVSRQLQKLSAIPDSDIAKVRDAYLSLKLKQIKGSYDNAGLSVGQDVKHQNSRKLLTDANTQLSILDDIAAASGYEFAELQADLQDLAAWSKGAGGSAALPKQSAYVAILDRIPAAQQRH